MMDLEIGGDDSGRSVDEGIQAVEEIGTQLTNSTDDHDFTVRLPEYSPDTNSRKQGRQRNPENHKKEKNKRRRNAGRPYESIKGDFVPPRTIGIPCKCKNGCRSRLLGMELQLFHSFWDLGSYDKQNLYLGCHIHVEQVKRHYKSRTKDLTKSPKRNVSYKYSVTIAGRQIFICKVEFLAVHGLQFSAKRVELLSRKLRDGMLIPESDARGKHKNHRSIDVDSINKVRDHINSIPKYVNSYSREVNPKKTYLDSDVTIAGLYRQYCEWINEQNEAIVENERGASVIKALNTTQELQPDSTNETNIENNYEVSEMDLSNKKYTVVSEDKYRRIFCSEHNIRLKLPRSDAKKNNAYIVAKQKVDLSSKFGEKN